MVAKPDVDIRLPDRIATKTDLMDAVHEVDSILEEAIQGHIRQEQTGKKFGVSEPSPALKALLKQREMELTIDSLQSLKQDLAAIRKQAASVRIVLSAEPDTAIKSKLVGWFRSNTETPILIRFGIQPSIAGGCLVYTPNHRYDLSLRSRILESKTRLATALEKA